MCCGHLMCFIQKINWNTTFTQIPAFWVIQFCLRYHTRASSSSLIHQRVASFVFIAITARIGGSHSCHIHISHCHIQVFGSSLLTGYRVCKWKKSPLCLYSCHREGWEKCHYKKINIWKYMVDWKFNFPFSVLNQG